MKLGSDGAGMWIKRFGDANYQFGEAVTVDIQDNVYLTGGCRGGLAPAPLLCSNVFEDAYLIRLSSTGSYLWGGAYGDGAYQSGFALASAVKITGSKNFPLIFPQVYVLGNFRGKINFGLGFLTTPDTPKNEDLFLVNFRF
jgi:hypothetical protein